jgi:choline transport protein
VKSRPSQAGRTNRAIAIQVNRRWTIPLNALCVSFLIVSLLSLINLGSAVAFNAIISLGVAALLFSYTISIICLRIKRWRGQPLPPARWSLGKFASSIETFAILFLSVVWVFTFFPLTRQVTPETMNWSSVIFSGVVFFALVYYFAYARKIYTGPVVLVKSIE